MSTPHHTPAECWPLGRPPLEDTPLGPGCYDVVCYAAERDQWDARLCAWVSLGVMLTAIITAVIGIGSLIQVFVFNTTPADGVMGFLFLSVSCGILAIVAAGVVIGSIVGVGQVICTYYDSTRQALLRETDIPLGVISVIPRDRPTLEPAHPQDSDRASYGTTSPHTLSTVPL